MSKLTVVVADDQPSIVTDMQRRIESAGAGLLSKVVPVADAELRDGIELLRKREADLASDKWDEEEEGVFDQADVLVLDYDMTELYEGSAYMTGEVVASLARRYSQAGIILSVNRFGGPQFDLRLRTPSSPWADLSLAHEDLASPGLWSPEWSDEYRPWYWPVLSGLAPAFELRVADALARKDEPILQALGFPEMVLRIMPSQILEDLAPDPDATFAKLADTLYPPKANRPPDSQLMRTAASAVGRWLSASVWPNQEVVIDAPHLAGLYPSLVDDPTDVDRLNQLAHIGSEPVPSLEADALEGCEFSADVWVDRSLWWSPLVLEHSGIQENEEPWSKEELAYVFAEDTSRFHPPEDCKRFRMEGLIKRRYVLHSRETQARAEYIPPSRLVE